MRQLIIIMLFLLGCQRNLESDPTSLFQSVSKNNYRPHSSHFYIVHRSSNQYFYGSNDYDVEFVFTVNNDSLDPVSYFQARKDSSEEYLRIKYPNNYKLIICLLEKDINFYSFIIARYNLKAINCWKDKDSTLNIDYSFKNHSELCFSENGFKDLATDKELIKSYNSKWVLRKY